MEEDVKSKNLFLNAVSVFSFLQICDKKLWFALGMQPKCSCYFSYELVQLI